MTSMGRPGRRVLALLGVALVAGGCAAMRPTFPPEPKPGTLFHAFQQPAGPGPFPAIVLLHTCGGVRGHLYDWANRLAAAGYASLIVDSFTPRGGRACSIPYFPATLDEVAEDAHAALEHLRNRPGIDGRRVGVMGFSYGASAALRLASPRYHRGLRRFGAAVSFYPICAPYPGSAPERSNNLLGDVDTPTLILMGEADTDTPSVVANCVAGVDRLRRGGRPVAIKLFPGAGHVFDVSHAEATRDAAAAMLQFFGQHLRGGAS
jgi:dienelactone hydrolase